MLPKCVSCSFGVEACDSRAYMVKNTSVRSSVIQFHTIIRSAEVNTEGKV